MTQEDPKIPDPTNPAHVDSGQGSGASSPNAQEGANSTGRSLEDVLEVATQALRRSLDDVSADPNKIEDLGDLIGSAELALSGSKQVERDGQSKSESSTDEPLERPKRGHSRSEVGFSIEELQVAINQLEEGLNEPLTLQSLQSPEEEISILLQAFPNAESEELRAAILERVVHVVEELPTTVLRNVVLGALKEYFEVLPHELLDHCFPILAYVLRESPIPFLKQLGDISRQASSNGRAALWPHLVNELLTDRGVKPEKDADSWIIVDELPEEYREDSIKRVCQLSSLRDRSVTLVPFRVDRINSYWLYASLLETTRTDSFGAAIFDALRLSPPDIEGASLAFFALDRFRNEYAPFLRLVLLDTRRDVVSRELREQSAALLVRALARLESERRKEPWVSEAIAWLGVRGYQPATEVLNRITTDRGRILHSWPFACRKEARRAIVRLENHKRSA